MSAKCPAADVALLCGGNDDSWKVRRVLQSFSCVGGERRKEEEEETKKKKKKVAGEGDEID